VGLTPNGLLSADPAASSVAPAEGAAASLPPGVAAVLKAAPSEGVCPSSIFLPRGSATPAQLARSEAIGTVLPLYSGIPAPIGLADYGLSSGPGESLLPSVQGTTSVRGTVDTNATGIVPLDLDLDTPDAFGIQLNAVLTGVDLFGQTGVTNGSSTTPYEFWAQNVVEYYPSTDTMVLVTNLWNFSGRFSLNSAVYEHGPDGVVVAGTVYEATLAIPTPITYPFNLSLFLNSSVVGGRDAVNFTVQLVGPGEQFTEPYDYVIFNSTAANGSSASSSANFTADGRQYDPEGLTNDFELDFGGPGAGSQADLVAAGAELGLAIWNATADGGSGGYVSVPSAFNYGGETGETATGATIGWSSGPGGPEGLATYGTMATGPTFLGGLWNASGPEGSYPVTIHSNPTNAFQVVTPVVVTPWANLTSTAGFPLGPVAQYQEAYDPALHETVLFGGWSPYSGVEGYTTTFASGKWSEGWLGSFTPPGRFGGGLVYDAADGYLLLFGGKAVGSSTTTNASQFLNDTWMFNVTGWHQLHPARAPSPRGYFAMAYDAADSEVVLFGGGIGTLRSPWDLYNDTWTFRAGQWTNVTTSAGAAPPARIEASAAYDASDGYVVLVGGASTTQTSVPCPFGYPDEWKFAGGHWTELAPTGTVPPAGEGSAWYDVGTHTTYYYEAQENLSGGNGSCASPGGDIFAYADGSWQLFSASGAPGSPVPRYAVLVVDDARDGYDLLVGGTTGPDGPFLSDTWSFQPTAVRPGSPPPRLVPEPSIGPTLTTSTFWLAPGNYTLDTELSGYASVNTTLDVDRPLTVNVTLAVNRSVGIYTPIWLWSNAQVAGVSTSGAGTPTQPYVLENVQPGPIGPAFGIYNDYAYPVYPAILFDRTNVSTEILRPSNFSTETNDFASPGPYLPQTNDPPFWFDQVSGVALVDASDVGGWFDSPYQEVTDAAVVFYESSGNLVAGCTFVGWGAGGATFFSGGTFTGPLNVGGGNNTVWGDTFQISGYHGDTDYIGGVALLLAEPNDLVYNNRFVPGTVGALFSGGLPYFGLDAVLLNENLYSGFAELFANDRWNVTVQPASQKHYASGFPSIPLYGSILGTSWQGGNFWWDYGLVTNPYGTLPFTESGYGAPAIYPGGDDAPLIPFALRSVTISTSGLPAGVAARFELSNTTYTGLFLGYLLDNVTLNGTPRTIYVPNGKYPYLLLDPNGYRWISGSVPPSGTLKVAGSRSVELSFGAGPSVEVTFVAQGFPGENSSGLVGVWCLQFSVLGMCGARSITVGDLTGVGKKFPVGYAYTALPDGDNLPFEEVKGKMVPATGSVAPVADLKVSVTFQPAYGITFYQSGLASGGWSVTLGGLTESAPANGFLVFVKENGSYAFTVGKEAGYRVHASPPSPLVVSGANFSVTVTFTPKK